MHIQFCSLKLKKKNISSIYELSVFQTQDPTQEFQIIEALFNHLWCLFTYWAQCLILGMKDPGSISSVVYLVYDVFGWMTAVAAVGLAAAVVAVCCGPAVFSVALASSAALLRW